MLLLQSLILLAFCNMQVMLEAEPRQWQSGYARPGGTPEQLHPFLAGAFKQVVLDLAVLRDSGATHIGISAASVQADDLRLAYSPVLTQLDIVRKDAADSNSSGTGRGGGIGSASMRGCGSFVISTVPEMRTAFGSGGALPPSASRSPSKSPPPREASSPSIGDTLLQRHQSLGTAGLGKLKRAASLGVPARPPASRILSDASPVKKVAGAAAAPSEASTSTSFHAHRCLAVDGRYHRHGLLATSMAGIRTAMLTVNPWAWCSRSAAKPAAKPAT